MSVVEPISRDVPLTTTEAMRQLDSIRNEVTDAYQQRRDADDAAEDANRLYEQESAKAFEIVESTTRDKPKAWKDLRDKKVANHPLDPEARRQAQRLLDLLGIDDTPVTVGDVEWIAGKAERAAKRHMDFTRHLEGVRSHLQTLASFGKDEFRASHFGPGGAS